MEHSAYDPQQQQQQHYQQADPQFAYDPSHAQAYGAYYAYHGYDPSSYHHYNAAAAAAYHPMADAAASYAAAAASYHPAAAPDLSHAAHDSSSSAQILHQHAAAGAGADHAQTTPGLNNAAAAAVAALSQLSEYAGSMTSAERARVDHYHSSLVQQHGHPPIDPYAFHHQHPYAGAVEGMAPQRGGFRGGRRGGFRGGRGNMGHYPPSMRGGGPSSFRGRGRGRGRGQSGRSNFERTYKAYGMPSSQHSAGSEDLSPQDVAVGQEQNSNDALGPSESNSAKLPRRSVPPFAWCDICRVDCTSMEILEQHKNGKRHKKTLRAFEEMQARQKRLAELEGKTYQDPEVVYPSVQEYKGPETNVEHEGAPHVAEENQTIAPEWNDAPLQADVEAKHDSSPSQNTPAIVKKELDESASAEKPSEDAVSGPALSEAPAAEATMESGALNKPMYLQKRKTTKSGRGGKRPRTFDPAYNRSFLPMERPRGGGPRERPRVCTVCSVTCDTLAVLECHLSGKKHQQKVQRYQGQGAVFGPINVFIPPNQNPPHGPEPLFYGFTNHAMFQHEPPYGGNNMPLQFVGHPLGGPPVPPVQATHPDGSLMTPQVMPNAVSHQDGYQGNPYPGAQGMAEGYVTQAAVSNLDGTGAGTTSATESEASPALEYGDPLGGAYALPGLDVKVEEAAKEDPEEDPEEEPAEEPGNAVVGKDGGDPVSG